tara:strand:+ start:663 stop:1148 length:486 start_codon:yes stop_codon:yes gene_type:complete
MLKDPQFWVFIAFVIFCLAVFNPIRKILLKSLDAKIKEIKDSLDQAEKVKNEARHTLSKIKLRQNEIEREIDSINNEAKNKIALAEKNQKNKLNDQLKKHMNLASIKIEQMARDANQEYQKKIIDTSINAAIITLESKLNDDEKINLIDHSINEFSTVLKN